MCVYHFMCLVKLSLFYWFLSVFLPLLVNKLHYEIIDNIAQFLSKI